MTRRPAGRLAAFALLLGLAVASPAAAEEAVTPTDPVTAAEPASIPTLGIAGLASQVVDALGVGTLGGDIGRTLDAIGIAATNPCAGSGALKKTSNGSFTILLMGSDYRRSPYIGERMDTLIVLNVARNGRIAMAAIPRDTVRVPLAGGGNSGSRRVNALYIGYKRSSVGRHAVDCKALDRVRRDIAKALDTQIPYYAMVRMDQFQQMVNQVGGFRMNVKATLIDYSRKNKKHKVFVPKTSNYQFSGGGACGKKPVKCRNALMYVRSRKGTEGGASNTDYRRLRRQQSVIFAVTKRVLARGSGSALSSLLQASKGRIYTNLPTTTSGALALYNVAKGSKFAAADGKVFGPRRWATYVGTYTYKLKLADVRKWVDRRFRP
ncbi:MAG: LCP family protein [Chloroflexi bacterium]|nr:LCP family protein [Chloroflexota bacterium]